jgi:hypothetical protein
MKKAVNTIMVSSGCLRICKMLDGTDFIFLFCKDWERTSLKPYVDMLERHSVRLMEEVRRSKIEKIGPFVRIFIYF